MKVLITGIHGFVGCNLVEALKYSHEIYGVDIVDKAKDGVIKTFDWDSLDKAPLVDAIFHLAGKAHDTKNQSDEEVYFRVNTGLTQKIFDYFLSSSAKKFFFFSSVKAAAETVVSDVLTEDVVPLPVGPYGESKIKAEEYIKSKWDIDGKKVYILRPCMIHGPGNKGNLNLLYSLISKGLPWPLGAFDNLRSFTSIDNLCFLIDKMLKSDIPSGVYNVGDDKPMSTNELIRVMCETLGKKPQIWMVPKPMVKCMASLGTLLHLPLNAERLRKLTDNYVVSNAKLKKALKIDSLPIDSRQGVRKTIKWFQLND